MLTDCFAQNMPRVWSECVFCFGTLLTKIQTVGYSAIFGANRIELQMWLGTSGKFSGSSSSDSVHFMWQQQAIRAFRGSQLEILACVMFTGDQARLEYQYSRI